VHTHLHHQEVKQTERGTAQAPYPQQATKSAFSTCLQKPTTTQLPLPPHVKKSSP